MKKIISVIFICFILLNTVSVNNLYAEDTVEAEETFWEIIMKGFNWFSPTGNGHTDMGADENGIGLGESVSNFILGDLMDIIKPIANFVILACGVFLGVKYLIASSMDKAAIKDSLISYLIGVAMYGLAIGIFNMFQDIFVAINTEASTTGSIDGVISLIWSTLIPLINMIAFASIIAVGIKYMMSPATDKAKIKEDLIRIVIGIVLIMCVANIADFIIDDVGSEFFPENETIN